MNRPADQTLSTDGGNSNQKIVNQVAALPLPNQFLNEQNLIYDGAEHQIYILPEADISQFMPSMSMAEERAGLGHNKWWNRAQQQPEGQHQPTMPQETASGIDDTRDSGCFTVPDLQQKLERIVNEHNLVQVGNESIYILPEPGGAEQLMRSLGNRQGDFSHSNMWSRTTVNNSEVEGRLSEILEHIKSIEAQLKTLTKLINPRRE